MSRKLLIANRGEIAIRIATAAAELGIPTVGICAQDDQYSLHTRKVGECLVLPKEGPMAYLDQEAIIKLAKETACDWIHPGYGFLSESASFATQCQQNGIYFIGPDPASLALFGDKIRARQLAASLNIPIIPGSEQLFTLEEAFQFWEGIASTGGLMIKARSGGGGRGIRAVFSKEELEEAWEPCQREAEKAFGEKGLYLEQRIQPARHIEVQLIGDGQGGYQYLGLRDCSLQRRNQKIIEISPCPGMVPTLEEKLKNSALELAKATNYKSAVTFEFLVEGIQLSHTSHYFFMEANPRIQVEHTITEELWGVDIVQFQLQVAMGHSLMEQGIAATSTIGKKGYCIQLRINAESVDANGNLLPASGTIQNLELATGKGIRLDVGTYAGYTVNPRFDSLIGKMICYTPANSFLKAIDKAYRALCESKIEGIPNNLSQLQYLLQSEEIRKSEFSIATVDALFKKNNTHSEFSHKELFFSNATDNQQNKSEKVIYNPHDWSLFKSTFAGVVLRVLITPGQAIIPGQPLVIVEAMKMEMEVQATEAGVVKEIYVQEGDLLQADQVLFLWESTSGVREGGELDHQIDIDYIRKDLQELIDRKRWLADENRPGAVARRRKYGQFTARENIAALIDEGSFIEYGSLAVAAQRKRRSLEDLIQNTPADGLVAGMATVNADHYGGDNSRCLVMAYDYTVLAGTQGTMNHKKMDRLLHLAEEWSIPIIVFAEGGGGRPGDVDFPIIAGLDVMTFTAYAKLSGIVPRISIVSRYCFAGNAALAGCSDVIIATRNTSLGMGGPAMIEGGGLGTYHPAEVGPVEFQSPNGVIDILVEDEQEAVAAAQQYLSYFQGDFPTWDCADQRLLRQAIPENRRRAYDIRKLIKILADENSMLELRKDFGVGMITAFIRIEGKAVGLIANNPIHLGGAIDADGADKAARFMQLCDAFQIPMVSLCDTPGIMVGPNAEKQGTVRHASRLFVIGAALEVPFFTIVLRKGYGLGAQAMASGSFHRPFFTIAWPAGEFGAMGLEGAVRLGYRKELEAIEDVEERQKKYEEMVAQAYRHGKATNMASMLEIDQVIDPMDTRKWVLAGIQSSLGGKEGRKKNRRIVDTW